MPPQSTASGLRVDQPPGHGADVVEELQGGGCLSAFRGVGEAENPEVDVDLLRGSVGDPVVGEPVPSGTAVAWRPGAPAVGRALWGRASRLPISLDADAIACPRGSGAFREAGSGPRCMVSRSAGLLVRRGSCRGRPSVAPSARSRGGLLRELRPRRWHAGGLPRGVERCTEAFRREGCPVRHCAVGEGRPDGHRRHNVKPGTPRRGPEVGGLCMVTSVLFMRPFQPL